MKVVVSVEMNQRPIANNGGSQVVPAVKVQSSMLSYHVEFLGKHVLGD